MEIPKELENELLKMCSSTFSPLTKADRAKYYPKLYAWWEKKVSTERILVPAVLRKAQEKQT